MTTQVRREMSKRDAMIRPSVPRPSDSSTQPAVVSEGTERGLLQTVKHRPQAKAHHNSTVTCKQD